VFWPAAFLVGGDEPMAAEFTQLKGQMVAIEPLIARTELFAAFESIPNEIQVFKYTYPRTE
jgi:hypothetical protein